MRDCRAAAIICITIILISAPAGSTFARTAIVDLATSPSEGDIATRVSAGSLNVRVVNLLPGRAYTVRWEKIETRVPPLRKPGDINWGSSPAGAVGDTGSALESCGELDGLVSDLFELNNEHEVEPIVNRIETEMVGCEKLPGSSPHSPSRDAVLARAEEAVDRTSRSLPSDASNWSLQAGSRIELTISRIANSGNTVDKEWKRTFKGPRHNRWTISYGFTFFPDKDKKYFTRPNNEVDGSFRIEEETNRGDFLFAPAIFYSYNTFPEKSDWFPNISAGLGFDLSDPVVYIGPSWGIGSNIRLVGGVVAHKQTHLDGRFSLDDPIIGESLDQEQLTEETYDFNYFLGLTFRFGLNESDDD